MHHTPLTLSIDTDYDWLSCLQFGFVDDGVPLAFYEVLVDERVALVRHPHTSNVAGFSVLTWSEFDASDYEALFDLTGPRFAVPQLGLVDAGIGEICLAAKAWLPREPTLDRYYFHQALRAPDPLRAIDAWNLSLEAGCLEAHYGLGYTHYETGDLKRAYRHLRTYTELAPWNGWAWCWHGKVCMAVEAYGEARAALTRAMEIEQRGGHETEAAELLEDLPAS